MLHNAIARFFIRLSACAAALLAGPAGAVTISEIHYHPPAGDEALEFVEIANETSTPADLSGWAFVEGIQFDFPAGTILGPRAYLVVARDAAALKARYGIANVLGDFTGLLENAGERITLANQSGVPVVGLRYRDAGKWPTEADGAGHSIVLKGLRLDPEEPESWAKSPETGGSPGRANFASGATPPPAKVFIHPGDAWRYRKGTEAFSAPETAWRDPAFDDSSWSEGPSGFGYGDNDDATVLEDMINLYTSVAIRKRIVLSSADLRAPGRILLGMDYDDGFIAWINGAEAARAHCGLPGEELAWNQTAPEAREAGVEEVFPVDRGLLREGENVLAIIAYNFSIGSSDLSLIPRLSLERSAAAAAAEPVLNELARGPGGTGWVEVYNPGDALDLSGWRLTDDPARPDPCVLPAGTVVAAGGFLAIDEAACGLPFAPIPLKLFLLAPDGACAAAAAFERAPPEGLAQGAAWSEARFPDGGPLDWTTLLPTRAAPNTVERTEDVVINEIFYHPPEDRIGEFIELFNRGASPVDLSGFRFDKGIDFTFPAGTTIPAGGYIVVAEDPALTAATYGLAGILGPWTGHLSNAGERILLVDRSGNPADDVRYHTGGDWDSLADGNGSSLERIDPRQDGSPGSAWEASDESGKASWEELSFRAAAYVPSAASELHLFLGGQGACRIDDVSISRAGGPNLVPNPGFEAATTSPWIIEGTHVHSRKTGSDRHSGAACLEMEASGRGDSQVNRLEVETSPAMTAGAYDVRLWARWLQGTSLLVVHGEFTAGPYGGRPGPATNLSGNTLGWRLRLSIPTDLGTPMAENSATIRLRESTGSANLGPVIGEAAQSPASPGAGMPVQVTARISDADGVARAAVLWRTESAAGAFTRADLSDDGLHGDGNAGDGLWGGTIPGAGQGVRVVYYLEAEDGTGATRGHPVEAPARTLLYQVQGNLGGALDTLRVVMDADRWAELQSRPLHSNELLDGSFVFDDEDCRQNVGIRYRGSPWGRPGRSNFRVRFADDAPLRRGLTALNLSSRGGAPNEGACHYLVDRSSSPTSAIPVADYRWGRAFFNGSDMGLFAWVQTFDKDLLEKWCGAEARGPLLKAIGRIAFDDGGNLVAWDGASFTHMGTSSENYRGYFKQSVHQTADLWDPFIALCQILDPKTTSSTAAFDAAIGGVLDVEEFLRCLGPQILQAGWDAFGVGNGHNGYVILDGRTGLWKLSPFDMDNTFQSQSTNYYTSYDPAVVRLLGRPGPRRIYQRALWEYSQGAWSAAGASPWLDAVQAATGLGTGGIRDYIATSSATLQASLRSSTTLAFKIVTNSGKDYTATTTPVEISGDAPLQVETLAFSVNGGDPAAIEPVWTTATRWKARFDVLPGENLFQFYGFDSQGSVAGTAAFRVLRSSGTLRVDDWTPRTGPAAGGTVVTFRGGGFVQGLQVLFGGAPSPRVTVADGSTATAEAPAAPAPYPGQGAADIELVAGPADRMVLPKAFAWDPEKMFLRGDPNGDGTADLADVLAILFFAFQGSAVKCFDAADVDDSGGVGITDVIVLLDALYRGGPPPAPPWPAPGFDPTADAFRCQ